MEPLQTDSEYLVVYTDEQPDCQTCGINTFTRFYPIVDDCVDVAYCERLRGNQRQLLRSSDESKGCNSAQCRLPPPPPTRLRQSLCQCARVQHAHLHRAELSVSPLCITFVRSDAESLSGNDALRPTLTAAKANCAEMRTRAASKRDRDGNPVVSNSSEANETSEKSDKTCTGWRSGCFGMTFARARSSSNVVHYLTARNLNGRDAHSNAMIALCTTARFHFPLANTVDSTPAARRSIRLRRSAIDNDDQFSCTRTTSTSETETDADDAAESCDGDSARLCPRMPMRSVLDSHLVRLPRETARSLAHEEASASDSDEQEQGPSDNSSQGELAQLLDERVASPSDSDDDEDDLVTQRRLIDELARRMPPRSRQSLHDSPSDSAAHFSLSDGPAQHTRSRERNRLHDLPSNSSNNDDVSLRIRLAMHRTANALRSAVNALDTNEADIVPDQHRLGVPERLRMRAARVLVRDPFRYPNAPPRRTLAAALNGRLVYSERSLPAALNGRLAEYIDRASLFRPKRPVVDDDDNSLNLPCSVYDCSGSLRAYESLVDTQARRLGALWREKEFDLGAVNKLFASAWLNDKQVMVATKCNRAFVLDANGRGRKTGPAAMVEIALLKGSGQSAPPRNPCGVHALELNPSGTLLATGGENPNDISVYNLPSLVPHAIFENGHEDWIFDMKWIDDEYLVSGGRDSNLVLWRANAAEAEERFARSTLITGTESGRRSIMGCKLDGDGEDAVPAHYSYLQPLCKRRCEHADKIRAICYNEARLELVVVSLDGSLHVFDAPSFRQRVTKSLVERHENVCITPSNDRSLYAIGSASHVTLIDARTLRHVVAVQSRYAQQGIRSVSFQNSLLTIGTGAGVVLFYDLRARKYLTLSDDCVQKRAGGNNNLELHCGSGYLAQDQDFNYMYLHYATNAVYTHAYDPSGTRLFTAGGPLAAGLWGNYAALWH